jgi:diguanylate cyclase (GGDEF)-like protein
VASTIVFIDPHARFRARATALLEARGHRVLGAASGEEASAILTDPQSAELIVVDERLPEGPGLAWLDALRKRGILIPAVLVLRPSAIGEPASAVRGAKGIRFVLRKPVDDEVLVETVQAFFEGRGVHASSLPRDGDPLRDEGRASTTEAEHSSRPPKASPSSPPPPKRPSSRPPRPSTTSSSRPPPFKARPKRTISAMQASYAASLPAKIQELTDALAEVRRVPDTAHVYGPAKLLAHRLRGTAGAFGFMMVGECAGRIEDALPRVLDADEAVRASTWRTIEQALGEAARASGPTAPKPRMPSSPRLLAGEPVSETKIKVSSFPPLGGPAMGKVLMVDDDPRFLEFVVELGHRKLLQVIPASNVAEALEMARVETPDAALIDVHLGPTELSFQLAKDLRALPSCSRMPIAFISAVSDIRARIEAANAGASLYLTKPIDVTAFDAAMQQLLALRSAEGRRVVLLHEDVTQRAKFASLLIERGWKVRAVSASPFLLGAIEESQPDLILLDAALSDVNSFDLCRALRTSLRWQDLPIAILSRVDNAEQRRAAFDAGADDYLVEPGRDELVARLEPRIDRARLGRERAGRDRLTGLLLRGAFLDQLAIRLSEARRHDRMLSLCLLDLDHFKAINDVRGHLSGDQVLMGLGKLLSTRFRAEDLRARWGGEEFMVAFPGEAAASSFTLFTRILDEFSQIAFTGEDGSRFSATFSAGISTFPEDGIEIEALVGIADRRLYAAKKRGRNRVVIRA